MSSKYGLPGMFIVWLCAFAVCADDIDRPGEAYCGETVTNFILFQKALNERCDVTGVNPVGSGCTDFGTLKNKCADLLPYFVDYDAIQNGYLNSNVRWVWTTNEETGGGTWRLRRPCSLPRLDKKRLSDICGLP